MAVTFKDAHSAKATLQARLGRRTWLRGIGVTEGPDGYRVRINVDAMTDDARSAITDFVDGVAVEVAVVGNIRSMLRKQGGRGMAIKFEKIKPGMDLLDVHSVRMGSTTMRELGCWDVRVVSVDGETRSAMVSWNGNPPKRWSERELRRLYVTPPKAYRDQCKRRRDGEWA